MLNRQVRWKPERSSGDAIVWIDVAKLDRVWRHSSGYVGVAGTGRDDVTRRRYVKFGKWILRRTQPIHMPHLGFVAGEVGFVNGRHRFAWLRDHGVSALPVTTHPENTGRLRREFGSSRRQSCITSPWNSAYDRRAQLALTLAVSPRLKRGSPSSWRFATRCPPLSVLQDAIDPASIAVWPIPAVRKRISNPASSR